MANGLIVVGRSIEDVYNEAMDYLLGRYFNYPEHLYPPEYGATEEYYIESGGPFYDAEARQHLRWMGYLPDGTYVGK